VARKPPPREYTAFQKVYIVLPTQLWKGFWTMSLVDSKLVRHPIDRRSIAATRRDWSDAGKREGREIGNRGKGGKGGEKDKKGKPGGERVWRAIV
jgi:hypothetical protein